MHAHEVEHVHEPGDMTGVCAALGELGDGAVITEKGLAEMFGRHPMTIKRAVARGELPPPVRLFGTPVWTAGVIVKHLQSRLEAESVDRRELERKTAVFPR